MAMASYEPLNGVPMTWFPGTKDESTRSIPYVAPQIPMHLPLMFTLAPKGPLKGVLATGSTAANLFGDEIFDLKGKFTTINTPFMNLMNDYANPMVIQRLVPETAAAEANLVLCLEVLRTPHYKEYAQNAFNGARRVDENNAFVFQDDVPEEGIYMQWRLVNLSKGGQAIEINDWETDITKVNIRPTLAHRNDPETKATVYPIMGIRAQWIGSYGNNIGVRIYKDETKLAQHIYNHQKAQLYKIEFVERSNERDAPSIITTRYGEQTVQFSFKEGAFNSQAGNESIDISEILFDRYNVEAQGSRPAQYGPFKDIYIFQDNLKKVLQEAFEVEQTLGGEQEFQGILPKDGYHMFDIVSGKNSRGADYKRVQVRNLLGNAESLIGESNVSLGREVVHYLGGGDDGIREGENINVLFDKLVREQLANFGNLQSPYLDMGQYPIRQFYDAGYTTETKAVIFRLLEKRQDINVTLSCLDLVNNNKQTNNAIQENSIGRVLATTARRYLESEMFGTPVMRALIIPQDMQLLNEPRYKKHVPMTIEVARMRAQYMSDPNGMRTGYGYDRPPYNHVVLGKNVSNVYANAAVREEQWGNAMSFFIHKTDKVVFCPGLRTVYTNETSILTSDINMQIVCDIDYICFQVWTELTGSTMSEDELIETSNRLIADRVRGRYDGRVVIVPNTHLSLLDEARGYSWSCQVDLYGANMRTVAKSWVVTHRLKDLNNG